MAGLSAVAAGALLGWAQQGPGFGWDRAVSRWIEDTVPMLTPLSEAVGWPLGERWPFAVAVFTAVAVLSSFKRQREAVFILGAIAGGIMMDWSLRALLSSLPPASSLLIYGAFLGSLGYAGHTIASATRPRVAIWSAASLTALACAVSAVHAGHLPSAVALSAFLAVSWLMVLRHLLSA
ncbi:MAG: hypothetical protein CMH57_09055 [Myxococcales bacterium]|nr:hypothetical protein [Myxococcales bacterium]